MKRHLCIWLPNWPTPNETANSEPPKKGVVQLESPSSGRVGRGSGRGGFDALPLSGPESPTLPEGECCRTSIEAVADRVQQQICPLVGLETFDSEPSESLLCDITGVAHLFDGEIGLLETVDELLKDIGVRGQMAIADSVGAAWAVAHNDLRLGESCQIVASCQIIAPGATREAIEPLPVESLRIEQETIETLSRLGVHFVGQLLQLPRSGLAPRLGKPLVRRIEQALGEVDEPIAVYRPPAEHVASHRLEYSTGDQNILADRIERLIREVKAGMATCHRGALRLTCRLDLEAHPPLTLEVGLFAPTIDTDHLCDLMIGQLETTKLLSPVTLLTLSVPLTGPLRSTQTSLFENNPNDVNNGISRLIDSLSSRLGCDSVVGVKIKDNPLPEKAFSVSPLAGNGKLGNGKSPIRSRKRVKNSSDPFSAHRFPSSRDAMRRPLLLFSDPIPIAVATDDGSFHLSSSSPSLPRCMRIAGTIHSVVRSWGPERIETSWWSGPSIRRDYYRIETDSARWWWIFRNLASKADGYCWMLHGRFN